MNPETVALLLTLAGNLLALVWGAATMASSLRQLAKSVDDLHEVCTSMQRTQGQHETRLSVVEDRLEIRPLNRRSTDE